MKKNVRGSLLERRLKLNRSKAGELSCLVQKRFISNIRLNDFSEVLLYRSIKNEVETDLIFVNVIESGIPVGYPKTFTNKKELIFCRTLSLKDFAVGAFKIPEPESNEIIKNFDRTLIVVPGIAFDYSGNRIGYGHGYYDSFMPKIDKYKSLAVGLCYDFQLLKQIPSQDNDIKVDLIITDKRVHYAGKN